ncbi:cupin domain-containing protein [Arenibaculum pallidiluteum]|uniref:cupin domain-containing protein n=1 Tax=Arenibaculum pallidiluteum TaxID=2812559 RepID=UPI001A96094B|nr:cupin domain-containing protein [Arenibaculum pallidiluteum]
MDRAVPQTYVAAEKHFLPDDGIFPNNAALPLLLYRATMPEHDTEARASAFERAFTRNGWHGTWRDGVFPYHHYHAEAHEVLGVAAGEAQLIFGGEGGVTVTIRPGDAVVIPAGVAHRNLGSTSDFLVVGAYPVGQSPDMRTGRPDERERALRTIPRVALPDADPIHGPGGPLDRHWHPAHRTGPVAVDLPAQRE